MLVSLLFFLPVLLLLVISSMFPDSFILGSAKHNVGFVTLIVACFPHLRLYLKKIIFRGCLSGLVVRPLDSGCKLWGLILLVAYRKVRGALNRHSLVPRLRIAWDMFFVFEPCLLRRVRPGKSGKPTPFRSEMYNTYHLKVK